LRLLVFIVFCFIMLMFRRLFSSTSPRSLWLQFRRHACSNGLVVRYIYLTRLVYSC
jgi:hypothetical protein